MSRRSRRCCCREPGARGAGRADRQVRSPSLLPYFGYPQYLAVVQVPTQSHIPDQLRVVHQICQETAGTKHKRPLEASAVSKKSRCCFSYTFYPRYPLNPCQTFILPMPCGGRIPLSRWGGQESWSPRQMAVGGRIRSW